MTPQQAQKSGNLRDEESGAELEIIDFEPLVDWLAVNYKRFGTTLEFVTDRSQEGSQFVKGFGGIGGILRYQIDFSELEPVDDGEWGGDEDDFI